MYDAIATTQFQYEGQSMILYDGTLSNVFANQNKEKLLLQDCQLNLVRCYFQK
jgi:hemoglobin/transferrin/lactoferrin receptor protein